jgi:uncharacterized protein YqjF (DUF2071 family)
VPLATEKQTDDGRAPPAGPPVMRQRWEHLLFLHWAWTPAEVQRTLPTGLTVDPWGERAWIGLVPFFMRAVRPGGLFAVPGISDFLELNLRTYVRDERGRPGVWFYSLDANQWLAVKIARSLFHLPYEHARMSATVGADGAVDYRSRRRGDDVESRFQWRPIGGARAAAAGSREFFLVERYRLFAYDRSRTGLWSGRVAHAPYRIGEVALGAWDERLFALAGFSPPNRAPDHVCAAGAVDVSVWPLRRVGAGD